MESERMQVQGEVAGPEAPDQPIYEGSQPNEQEVSPQGQTQQAPPQPALGVPDKFITQDGTVDVEALAQSYMELERMRSGMPSEGDPMSEESPLPQGQEGGLVSADELQDFSDQVLQDGNLSDATYADLESRGLPRELVEAYVEGQKALGQQYQNELLGAVGGQEAYNQLTEWATKNLSEAEIDAYDAAMESGDQNTIMMNIQGLYARFQQAEGRPNLIAGEVGSIGSGNAYRSWAEVTAAMKDSRYQTDPAYRADVTNRLAVSNLQ